MATSQHLRSFSGLWISKTPCGVWCRFLPFQHAFGEASVASAVSAGCWCNGMKRKASVRPGHRWHFLSRYLKSCSPWQLPRIFSKKITWRLSWWLEDGDFFFFSFGVCIGKAIVVGGVSGNTFLVRMPCFLGDISYIFLVPGCTCQSGWIENPGEIRDFHGFSPLSQIAFHGCLGIAWKWQDFQTIPESIVAKTDAQNMWFCVGSQWLQKLQLQYTIIMWIIEIWYPSYLYEHLKNTFLRYHV